VTLLGSTTLTVTRDAGTYVDGDWVPSTSTLTIRGSLQPISGRERQSLPEGYRSPGRFKLYTRAVLQGAVGGDAGHNADLITYRGSVFEVASIEDWTEHRASTAHHQYLLLARAEDGNP